MKISKNSSDALARETMDRLDQLAAISESPEHLARRYLTTEHAAANEIVSDWMRAAGMTVRTDEAANVIGRYDGTDPTAPVLLIGSHLDTVIDAGRYDGMLGVVLPIGCVARLHEEGRRLAFPIEIIGFGDEEGVRFQSTYLGSSPVAGTFDRSLLERTDRDDTTLAAALSRFGLDPDRISDAARAPSDIRGYVEIHIEQGPVLERLDRPVGVVTGIAGATRLAVTVRGEAGHAGTVPMSGRRDALAAAAEIVLAVENICSSRAGVVGTVGQLEALPGAVNVIPGTARLTIDIRSAADEDRNAVLMGLRDRIGDIGRARNVSISVEQTHAVASVACADSLVSTLSAAADACGIEAPLLPSGAGHDAAAMSALTDVGMLFVRCKGGVSHSPAEEIAREDVAAAAHVLMAFLDAANKEASN